MKFIQVTVILIMASVPTFAHLKFDKIGDCSLQRVENVIDKYKMKFVCYKSNFDKNILSNLSSAQCREIEPFRGDQVLIAQFINCEMDELPKGFFQIYSQVNVLNISNMELKIFPTDSHDNISSLVDLYASFNNLTEAPPFPSSNNLINLDLSNNPIMVLNALSFKNLKKLTKLNLANTGLAEIPEDIFMNQEYLVVIDLSHNFLTKLHAKELLPSYYTLETLYLDANNLTELDEMPGSIFSRLKFLTLTENQIKCDTYKSFINSNGLQKVHLSKDINYGEYYDSYKHYNEWCENI